jgi:hypothetical protein
MVGLRRQDGLPYAAAEAAETATPEATEAATTAPRRIVGTPRHGLRRGQPAGDLDSERFRSIPRTQGHLWGTLGPSIRPTLFNDA